MTRHSASCFTLNSSVLFGLVTPLFLSNLPSAFNKVLLSLSLSLPIPRPIGSLSLPVLSVFKPPVYTLFARLSAIFFQKQVSSPGFCLLWLLPVACWPACLYLVNLTTQHTPVLGAAILSTWSSILHTPAGCPLSCPSATPIVLPHSVNVILCLF